MQVKCDRCGEFECICGDVAFEAWIEDELQAQQDEPLNDACERLNG